MTAKAFTPSGPPMATGQTKFLGSCYSTSQTANFAAYFNQVTPENAGKWGSVEVTRDVMNWTQLDEAYNFAKTNGMKFRFHILVWGSQQPSWISTLSTAEKRAEIEEWYAAVAARYPDLDYVEVVNEPLHAPPNGETIAFSTTKAANYSDALGGAGTSGWEWLVESFRLARQYFPGKKLVLNEYGLLNDGSSVSRYVQIINLLKAENLVDVIATQAHAFETYQIPDQTLKNNLATLAATGVPIMITEMDIDGPTDQIQLAEYQRVFPILWNHPSVIGITLWGYRPGLWRNAQGAYLVLADNTERPAMQWLKTFVGNFPPVVTASQVFPVQTSAVNGTAVGTVAATDANAGTTLQGWAITGGTGASYFAINATTGQVTVSNRAGLDLVGVGSYTLQVTVGDGIATSAAGTLTILTPASAPSATAQPAAAAVAVGANASFTFGVSSPIAFTRQWQVSSDSGATWSDLANGGVYSSATGETLQITVATLAMNGYRFRCVATNPAGSVTSSVVSLSVSSLVTADFNQDGKGDLILQNTLLGERKIWLMDGATIGSEVSLGQVALDWQIAGTADFNADGKADILWQNRTTGERGVWLMDGTTNSGWVSIGVVPLEWEIVAAADFNRDGSPDLLWRNATTGERYLWLMNGTAVLSSINLGTAPLEWQMAGAADFNADGGADILWQNTTTGERGIWLMNGWIFVGEVSLGSPSLDWQIAGTADLNGDGKADILWENSVTDELAVWLMDGTSVSSSVSLGNLTGEWILGSAPRAPRVPVIGPDFNGDRSPDIILENTSTGERKVWLMDGTTQLSSAPLGTIGTEWSIAGAADFNGDRSADIVWENTTTGERYLWLMAGTTRLSAVSLGTVATAWRIVAVGDLNGDAKPDLIWENTSTGERYLWRMDGTALSAQTTLGTVDLAWHIAGAADFNADGKTDIVWENTTTGERYVWLMDGTNHLSSVSLGTVDTDWHIAGVGDYNADAKPDLVWENTTTGERYVWLMNGTTRISSVSLGVAPTDWKIVN